MGTIGEMAESSERLEKTSEKVREGSQQIFSNKMKRIDRIFQF